jgi:hypothetical protein
VNLLIYNFEFQIIKIQVLKKFRLKKSQKIWNELIASENFIKNNDLCEFEENFAMTWLLEKFKLK